MKKILKSLLFLMIMTLTLGSNSVQAFNSATHLHIAERVFPNCTDKIDLYYGSIAPDLALYVAQLDKWPTAFDDTHYDYMDLRSGASSFTQMAFATGWLTHNEEWGADYYAHIDYPPFAIGGVKKGYVIAKAEELSLETGLPVDFAHYAIEVAIDLLLKKYDDPKLGAKLLVANWLRSYQDRHLLVKVLVWQTPRRTDWLTLVTAEWTFRSLVHRYAMALALQSPEDKAALAELGAQLASEMYEIDVTAEEVRELLEVAVDLCEPDYKDVIDFTIQQIKEELD